MNSFKITLSKAKRSSKDSEIVNSAIESFRKQELLSNATEIKLTVDEKRPPQFHTLPKVHKPNTPEKPALSSIECHKNKISKYVEHNLQPHAK